MLEQRRQPVGEGEHEREESVARREAHRARRVALQRRERPLAREENVARLGAHLAQLLRTGILGGGGTGRELQGGVVIVRHGGSEVSEACA